MIVMSPPRGGVVPLKRLTLESTGREVFPDIEIGGIVRVITEAEARELEGEGWTRPAGKIAAGDLRKALQSEARRAGLGVLPSDTITDRALRKRARVAELRHAGHDVEDHPRREFGEVDAGRHGRVVVSHDQGANEVAVHGVNFELEDVDVDLRGAFRIASVAFDAAQDAEAQTSARALIGSVVTSILDRHSSIADLVRQQKVRQRYD